jgi:hypothetical protein
MRRSRGLRAGSSAGFGRLDGNLRRTSGGGGSLRSISGSIGDGAAQA